MSTQVKKRRNSSFKKQTRAHRGKKILLIIITVVLCAALIGGSVYVLWRFSDEFTKFPWADQIKSEETGRTDGGVTPGTIKDGYYLELEGTQFGNGGVAHLESGSVFTVSEKFGTDYTVKMTARAGSDFSFTLGAEPYKWSNVKGDDFTAGFSIARSEAGFTVTFGTLEEIISKVKGNAVIIQEAINPAIGEKFTMTVSGNNHAVTLNFTTRVQDVDLSDDALVM